MGADHSHLKGLEIDTKAIETTDFWTTYNGQLRNKSELATPITIFQGEHVITGQLWTDKSPLQRATRNLMLYRHPSILRFITSWEKGSTHYLATERCKPLSMVLATQNDTQICLGLKSILDALIFLVEKANMCHLNVCTSSVYVNSSGAWRLGGLEYLWPRADVNQILIDRSQSYRYRNAFDKDESKSSNLYGIEQFAFGVMCEEILSCRKENLTIPNVAEFRKYCIEHLRHANTQQRSSLSKLLQHSYFNQDFITIHSFLFELPLKSATEKQQFFTGLVDRLRAFDENIVATELIDLLLSRIVLLDDTAKLATIPFLLQPNAKDDLATSSIEPIFSVETFTEHVTPKIQQLFLVRDIQVRLILLQYFSAYMNYFPSNEMLSDHILPQLLLGIKDTNDEIVAATLRCLADLIPILGSSIVVGKNRGRIFADGKPNEMMDKQIKMPITVKWPDARSITPVMNGAGINTDFVSHSPMATDTNNETSDSFVPLINAKTALNELLPERLSPDGGEDVELTNLQTEFDDAGDDDGDWSDWENDAQNDTKIAPHIEDIIESNNTITTNNHITALKYERSISNSSAKKNNNFIKDIKEIEIKSVQSQLNDEINDLFKDMEPIIVTKSTLLPENISNVASMQSVVSSKVAELKIDQSRFAVNAELNDDIGDDTAWGDETNGWED